jgi:hypothetical protein
MRSASLSSLHPSPYQHSGGNSRRSLLMVMTPSSPPKEKARWRQGKPSWLACSGLLDAACCAFCGICAATVEFVAAVALRRSTSQSMPHTHASCQHQLSACMSPKAARVEAPHCVSHARIRGVPTDAADSNGAIPLHLASFYGHLKIIEITLLLQHGATAIPATRSTSRRIELAPLVGTIIDDSPSGMPPAEPLGPSSQPTFGLWIGAQSKGKYPLPRS